VRLNSLLTASRLRNDRRGHGHFQNFKARELGTVKLDKPGRTTLTVRPQSKPRVAVNGLAIGDVEPASTIGDSLPAQSGMVPTGWPPCGTRRASMRQWRFATPRVPLGVPPNAVAVTEKGRFLNQAR